MGYRGLRTLRRGSGGMSFCNRRVGFLGRFEVIKDRYLHFEARG